jgi:Leucine-rich repeat (LRR) protein
MFKGSLQKWLDANGLTRDVRAIDTATLKTRGFPADLGALPNLTEIVFRGETGNTLSRLKSVPPGLRRVGFIHCKITALPDAAFAHDAIEMLMVEGCNISTLPARIAVLPNLRGVSLYLCGMKQIPEQLFDNPNVARAQFSAMPISDLPDRFGGWPNLVSLELQQNTDLLALPPSVCGLPHLQELLIHGCPQISIPAEIAKCAGLQRLRLSDLGLQSLPAFVCKMTSLQELDLTRNEIETIPSDMANLAALTSLNLSHNPIEEIKAIPPVATLNARHTKLKSLAFLTEKSAANLTSLDISEILLCDLSNLRFAVHMQTLDISEMGLAALPDAIREMRDLSVLYALANHIHDVPLLESVRKLHLNKNPIESIAMPPNVVLLNLEQVAQKGRAGVEGIKGLEASSTLVTLSLAGNRLRHVPAFVADCPNLRNLVLKNNLLREVPVDPRLRHLELSANELHGIDAAVSSMAELECLDVSGNANVTCVPEGVCALPRLEFLGLYGTGVKAKPADFGANGRMVAVDSHGNYTTPEVASTPFAQLEPFAEISKK